MASELRYCSVLPNISAQRLWEIYLAWTFCLGSWENHFLSLEGSMKITLALHSEASLIMPEFWQRICTKWDIESNCRCKWSCQAYGYINIHVWHISSALNLVPTGCGSFEVKITPNQACDISCDMCDDVTHNGNCPPPLCYFSLVYIEVWDKKHIDLPHKPGGWHPPASTFPKQVFKNFQTPTQG